MSPSIPPAEAVPSALRERDQWCCWRNQECDGKTTKVPLDPQTGRFASTTDPEPWRDFATALDRAESSGEGVGFVFTETDAIVGVDLDDCRVPATGELTDWAADTVARLDSYTEISLSGPGVHVLVRGALPEGRNRHGDVELYETARFFPVTGDHLEATTTTVEARTEALEAVHTEYVAPDDESTPESVTRGSESVDLEDEELLRRAKAAANGEKFTRLWQETTRGYERATETIRARLAALETELDRLERENDRLREALAEAREQRLAPDAEADGVEASPSGSGIDIVDRVRRWLETGTE